MTLRIFIGFDPRQPIAFTTLAYSLMKYATRPIAIIPLILNALPIRRQGLTPFTYSRFLVPWLCDYQGWALFLDTDIIAASDVTQIMQYADPGKDVLVSQNELKFEWSSAMLFNCARCQILTPKYVQTAESLHGLKWADNIGALPPSWNHLVGYDQPADANLIHFTQGIPCFPETHDSEHGPLWRLLAREATSSLPWRELMGNSVHAKPVYQRLNSTT